LRGPTPDLKGSADLAGEVQILAEWLSDLRERGVAPGEIAIFARTRRALQERVEPALKRTGMSSTWCVSAWNKGSDAILVQVRLFCTD
jgi:hypothetical protein